MCNLNVDNLGAIIPKMMISAEWRDQNLTRNQYSNEIVTIPFNR